ncbi:MAG: ADP-ribosylglycohydrolase family protein [Candidatus Deferrimicrobiaceae bacterium]
MDDLTPNFLSKILRKRIENLGYSSLKKFTEDRKDFRYSYELLRQVVYGGRIPRAETLFEILQTMRFSPSQIHKMMELHFGGFPGREAVAPGQASRFPETRKREDLSPAERQAISAGADADEPGMPGAHIDLLADSPEETSSSLLQSLQKIPLKGNEDFWEMARALALQAERKVLRMAKREADQPLLFEKEPEAIYQFLVRKTKVPSYMAKGESQTFEFVGGIDYQDRFRGALLGAAIGEILGRATQGLSPRDIRELYGKIDRESTPDALGGPVQDGSPPACLLLSRALLKARKLDPEGIASVYVKSRRLPGSGHHAEFARNLSDRGFPWFEAGATVSETAPAARLTPLALLRAGNFRRLKLEAGIEASITHPHAAAIAGAIVQAVAIARLLHTPAGALDVLGFARGLSHVVTGIEVDRSTRGKSGRTAPALWRKLGTDLTALLLRRAEMADVQEALGNGASVPEGIPFAWACFLRNPEDYGAAVFSAVNFGHEAEANGAMAGSLAGGYVGATGIPKAFLGGLSWREELQASADGLLALARRDS